MSNKEDELNFDDDIFNGMDDPLMGDPDEPAKEKGLKGAVKNAWDGATDDFKSVSSIAKKTGSYTKDWLRGSSGVSREMSDIFDAFDAGKNALDKNIEAFRKETNTMAKSLRALAPDILGIKELLGKFIDDDEYRMESEAARREREIRSSVESVLGSIEEQQAKRAELEQELEEKRTATTNEILKDVAGSAIFIKRYHSDFTTNYYRKSLELQFRQNLISQDMLATVQAMAKSNDVYYKAIVRNTSLPDLAKQHQLQLMGADIKQKLRNNFIDKYVMDNDVFKAIGKNVTNRINSLGGNVLSMMGFGNDLLENLVEAKQQMSEYGDPMMVAASMAGSNASNWLFSTALGRILFRLAATETGHKVISEIRHLADDPSNYFNNKVKDSENDQSAWGKAKNMVFRELANITSVTNRTESLKLNVGTLDGAASFDNVTKNTINRVIPDLLGMIYNETKGVRLGIKDEVLKMEVPVFDHVNNKWSTTSKIAKEMRSKVSNLTYEKTDYRGIANALKDEGFVKELKALGYELDDKQIDAISRAAAISTMNVSSNGLELFKSKVFRDHLDPAMLDIIDNIVAAGNAMYIKDPNNANSFSTLLKDATIGARNSIPNAVRILDEYASAGMLRELNRAGYVTKDENGMYNASNDTVRKDMLKKYGKVLRSGAYAIGSEVNTYELATINDYLDLFKAGTSEALDTIVDMKKYLPPRANTILTNIGEAVSKDMESLGNKAESYITNKIEELDKYIQTEEYKNLPEQTKKKISAFREDAVNYVREKVNNKQGLFSRFTSKVRGGTKSTIRNTLSFLRGEKKINAGQIMGGIKEDIVGKFKGVTEAYKAGGLEGVKSHISSGAVETLKSLNEKTVKSIYNKLPQELRTELEKTQRENGSTRLLSKDYYVTAISTAYDTLPDDLKETLVGNAVSKKIASFGKAIASTNTYQALKSSMGIAKDGLVEAYDNAKGTKTGSAIYNYVKGTGRTLKGLKTKAEIIGLIKDAVEAKDTSLLDEIEVKIHSEGFGNDKALLDNLKAARNTIASGKTLAERAWGSLKNITDPVEYGAAAGKLLNSFWSYVPMGGLIKFTAMGIGGYMKLLRKADKWVRNKIFGNTIGLPFKAIRSVYRGLKNPGNAFSKFTRYGGLGLGLAGLALGGVGGLGLGLAGMGLAAKGPKGLVGLPLLGAYGMFKTAQFGTNLFAHITGLDGLKNMIMNLLKSPLSLTVWLIDKGKTKAQKAEGYGLMAYFKSKAQEVGMGIEEWAKSPEGEEEIRRKEQEAAQEIIKGKDNPLERIGAIDSKGFFKKKKPKKLDPGERTKLTNSLLDNGFTPEEAHKFMFHAENSHDQYHRDQLNELLMSKGIDPIKTRGPGFFAKLKSVGGIFKRRSKLDMLASRRHGRFGAIGRMGARFRRGIGNAAGFVGGLLTGNYINRGIGGITDYGDPYAVGEDFLYTNDGQRIQNSFANGRGAYENYMRNQAAKENNPGWLSKILPILTGVGGTLARILGGVLKFKTWLPILLGKGIWELGKSIYNIGSKTWEWIGDVGTKVKNMSEAVTKRLGWIVEGVVGIGRKFLGELFLKKAPVFVDDVTRLPTEAYSIDAKNLFKEGNANKSAAIEAAKQFLEKNGYAADDANLKTFIDSYTSGSLGSLEYDSVNKKFVGELGTFTDGVTVAKLNARTVKVNVTNKLNAAKDWVYTKVTNVTGAIKDAINAGIDKVKGWARKFLDVAKNVLKGAINQAANFIMTETSRAIGFLKAGFEKVLEFFGLDIKSNGNTGGMLAVFKDIFEAVGSKASALWENVQSIGSAMMTYGGAIQEYLKRFIDIVSDFMSGSNKALLMDKIKTIIGDIKVLYASAKNSKAFKIIKSIMIMLWKLLTIIDRIGGVVFGPLLKAFLKLLTWVASIVGLGVPTGGIASVLIILLMIYLYVDDFLDHYNHWNGNSNYSIFYSLIYSLSSGSLLGLDGYLDIMHYVKDTSGNELEKNIEKGKAGLPDKMIKEINQADNVETSTIAQSTQGSTTSSSPYSLDGKPSATIATKETTYNAARANAISVLDGQQPKLQPKYTNNLSKALEGKNFKDIDFSSVTKTLDSNTQKALAQGEESLNIQAESLSALKKNNELMQELITQLTTGTASYGITTPYFKQ